MMSDDEVMVERREASSRDGCEVQLGLILRIESRSHYTRYKESGWDAVVQTVLFRKQCARQTLPRQRNPFCARGSIQNSPSEKERDESQTRGYRRREKRATRGGGIYNVVV